MPRFLCGASAFRIVAGLAILYQYLNVYSVRHYLFGPDGVFAFDTFSSDVAGTGSFSLYACSSAGWFFELVYHLGILVAVLWLIGWRTRVMTPIQWVLLWSLHERNPTLLDGGDNLMQLVLLYSCFVDVSRHWSVDARRRKARGEGAMSPTSAMFHNAGVLACAIQLSLVYGVAGLCKVQGETWRNGTALYYALRGGEFTWPGYSEWIFENRILLTALAYATVAFQISFPFLLFLGRKTRLVAVGLGLCFHVGIMSMMALVTFATFMMATDLMFVTDAEYVRLGAWLHRARVRVRRVGGRDHVSDKLRMD